MTGSAYFWGTMPVKTGNDVELAARLLRASELVAIPTETVYGLAANALNAKAVVKIFEAKERPFFDPLIVHIHSPDQVALYAAEVPPMARRLAETFWPGPLTLILPRQPLIPDIVTAGQNTVGLRIPDHPLTRALLQQLDFPLAAPSANPFGYVSPTEPAHVQEQLGERISYILDGGKCEVGIESTIVGFEAGEPVIYRLGGIAVEAIEAVAGRVRLELNQSSNPSAPGQLKSHYAPRIPLLLGHVPALLLQHSGKKVGVISFQQQYQSPDLARQWVLSPGGNLLKAARLLFRALREADAADLDLIVAEVFPEEGLGRAINDRLRRAAAR